MRYKKPKVKRPPGRPRKDGQPPYMRLRIRPDSLKAVKILAAHMEVDWQDLLDEIIQVGAGYVYQRRQLHLANPLEPIPDIWDKLPMPAKIKSLKGTELPAL